jgi:hypothetical protein
MVHTMTEVLEVPLMSIGSTTLTRPNLQLGLEADDAFYLDRLPRISSAGHLNLDALPPPSLATEIEITPSALDRLAIYAAMAISEVWRFDGSNLKFHRHQEDGTYQEIEQSKALPGIDVHDISRFATQELADHTAWTRAFRQWLHETVVSIFHADRGDE